MTDADKVKMLPCPFCGSAAVVKRRATTIVCCEVCTATTFQINGDPQSAIVAWNIRAPIKADAGQEPVKLKFPVELLCRNYVERLQAISSWIDSLPPLYTNPPANKDSERLAFILGHGMPTEWNTPDGLEYGYGLSPQELFTTPIEAIDAAISASKIRD